jgi:hypothetical protein
MDIDTSENVRKVIEEETTMRKNRTQFVAESDEGESSLAYRKQMNRDGSPSETVSATYHWAPGTELARAASLAAA